MRWGQSGGCRAALACVILIGLGFNQGCNDTDATVQGSSDGTAQVDGGPVGPGTTANPRAAQPAPYEAPPPAKPSVADVQMSEAEKAMCNVLVGDAFPEFELPSVAADGSAGDVAASSSLLGERLTVVLFWDSNGFQSPTALGDLGPDVADPYQALGVKVFGVAVRESADSAREQIEFAEAKFPNLLDSDGAAFAQVGSVALPRVFLLDGDGKILWFDIEYSRTTRRELASAIESVVGSPKTVEVAAE